MGRRNISLCACVNPVDYSEELRAISSPSKGVATVVFEASRFVLGGIANPTPNLCWIQICLSPRLVAKQSYRPQSALLFTAEARIGVHRPFQRYLY